MTERQEELQLPLRIVVPETVPKLVTEQDETGVRVAVAVGVRVAVGVGVNVLVGVGVDVLVGVGVDVLVGVGVDVLVGVGVDVLVGVGVAVAAARIVTSLVSESKSPVLPTRYSRAVTVTLPAQHAFRVGRRLVVSTRLRVRLSYVEQRDQLFEKPARLLFVLNSTLYSWVLSRLKARTVKASLLPAVM